MDSGWELNAHSYEQIPMHKLDDQRAVIAKTMRVIEKFSGKRPRGWFGPGLTQTLRHRSTIWPKPASNTSATTCSTTIPSR